MIILYLKYDIYIVILYATFRNAIFAFENGSFLQKKYSRMQKNFINENQTIFFRKLYLTVQLQKM